MSNYTKIDLKYIRDVDVVMGRIWREPDAWSHRRRRRHRELAKRRNTEWSERVYHPTGLPYLPDGDRWERLCNGYLLTVTKQVPPGLLVVLSGLPNEAKERIIKSAGLAEVDTTPDHPHSKAWCVFINGRYYGIVDQYVDSMGVIKQIQSHAEMLVGCHHAYRSWCLGNPYMRKYDGERVKLTYLPTDRPRTALPLPERAQMVNWKAYTIK